MLLAGALLALPLLTACAGAQSDQAATPSDDDVYEVGPGMGLGSVPPGSEAAFTFFWRAGELRMVVDYLERKTTSNGLVYVDRGDVLELVVTDREPVLRRRQ
jgi:hypothetical protein